MLNDQFSNNPLAKVVQESNSEARSLLTNKKDWRPHTRSSTDNKRIDPEKHLKAIDRIRNLGYDYEHIRDKLQDASSDINQIYRAFVK